MAARAVSRFATEVVNRPTAWSAFRDIGRPNISPDAGIKFHAYLRGFFDRKAVIDALTEAEWVVLSKFGAYLRQTAMTSIRKAGKSGTPSVPGTPPRSHDKRLVKGRAKHLLRTMMFFAFDGNDRTVVVGPATINKPTGAPSYCEFGGKASRPNENGGGYVTVTYPKRPFMAPALAREIPRFPQLFHGAFGGKASVRGPGG